MKKKAKISAYEEEYVKALRNEKEVRANLSKAQSDYDKALANYMDKLGKYGASYDDYINKTDAYYEAQNKLSASGDKTGHVFENTKIALDKAKGSMAEITESLKNYESQVRTTDDTTESAVAGLLEEYGRWEKDGHYTFDSIEAGITDLNDALDEHGERWEASGEKEREVNKLTREQLISDCIAKSLQLGLSYDEMTKKMGSAWDTMTDKEKESLETQYNDLKKAKDTEKELINNQKDALLKVLDDYNIGRSDKQAKQWKQELEEAQKNGSEQGQEYIDNLVKDLMTGKIKTDQQGDEIGKGFKSNLEKNIAYFKSDDGDARSKLDALNRLTLQDKVAWLEFKSKTNGFKLVNGIVGGEGIVSIKEFANGGFPDMGQMFVAREAGPELVGRIGKKTAVANNDQIVSAVSGGVYNAMRSAMAGMSGGGKFEIHTTVEIDKKAVGKSVVDYNNGIVKQTGKSPLLI